MGQLDEARTVPACDWEPDNTFTRRNLQLLSSRLVGRWHFAMVNDDACNRQFETALKDVVTADSVVLNIGAGLLSTIADHAGAKQVIACEANPTLAELASEVVKSDRYSDCIRVINKPSQQLDPATDFPRKQPARCAGR